MANRGKRDGCPRPAKIFETKRQETRDNYLVVSCLLSLSFSLATLAVAIPQKRRDIQIIAAAERWRGAWRRLGRRALRLGRLLSCGNRNELRLGRLLLAVHRRRREGA